MGTIRLQINITLTHMSQVSDPNTFDKVKPVLDELVLLARKKCQDSSELFWLEVCFQKWFIAKYIWI